MESDASADEGSNVVVRVFGGNAYTNSSVKLYLAYNTAAAADVDLKKGTADGMTPKGGLKFPLTLSWAAGEVGEKVVAIPTKADKTVEDDETFTLQLAEKKAKYTTVKASGSATLVPVDDEHGAVFFYLTPKGLSPHVRCVTIPWPVE